MVRVPVAKLSAVDAASDTKPPAAVTAFKPGNIAAESATRPAAAFDTAACTAPSTEAATALAAAVDGGRTPVAAVRWLRSTLGAVTAAFGGVLMAAAACWAPNGDTLAAGGAALRMLGGVAREEAWAAEAALLPKVTCFSGSVKLRASELGSRLVA